jgi:hypothetical protein
MHKPFEKNNSYGRNGLGGRPKGSRNKLCRAVLEDLIADWQEGGAAAIKFMRMERPAEYVRAMVSILPKELILESGMENLDDDELDHMISMLRERALAARQQQALELKPEPKLLNGRH